MIRNLFAITAAASLAFAPVAAQAGTRAADAGVSLAPFSQQISRAASPVTDPNDLDGDNDILVFILFGGIAAAIIAIFASSGSEPGELPGGGASPGTGT